MRPRPSARHVTEPRHPTNRRRRATRTSAGPEAVVTREERALFVGARRSVDPNTPRAVVIFLPRHGVERMLSHLLQTSSNAACRPPVASSLLTEARGNLSIGTVKSSGSNSSDRLSSLMRPRSFPCA